MARNLVAEGLVTAPTQSPQTILNFDQIGIPKEREKYAQEAFNKASQSQLAQVNPDYPFVFVSKLFQESGFNPNAVGPENTRGRGRAKGIAQILDSTAPELGLSDPFDPSASIDAAIKFDERSARTLANNGIDPTTENILAAYNAGPGAVINAGGVPNFTQTQDYVNKIVNQHTPLFKQAFTPVQQHAGQTPTPRQPRNLVAEGIVKVPRETQPTIEQEIAQGRANLASITPSTQGGIDRQDMTGFLEQFQQGLLFNFGDEASAAMQAGIEFAQSLATGNPIDIQESFRTNLQTNRERLEQFQRENPIASQIAQGTGIAVPALLTGGATTASRTGQGIASQALEGATLGALGAGVATAGETEEDRLGAFTEGAAVGFGVGGALGGTLGAITRRGFSKEVQDAIPSNQALRTRAGNLYKEIEELGVTIKPKSYDNLVSRLNSKAKDSGFFAANHPKVSNALKEFENQSGQSLSLKDIDQLRRVLRSAGGSIEPDERRIASILIDDLDNYVSGLKTNDVLTGNATGAAEAFRDARLMWTRLKKSEILDEAFFKAEDQASGFENGLRIQFRSILNNKNKRNQFSKDEIKAIRRVVQGGPIENNLRRLGRFSFGSGQQSNILGGSIGSAAGFGTAGPIGAVAVPAAAQIAKTAAERLTQSNARFASQLVRAGADPNKITRAYLRLEQKNPDELAGLLLNAGIRNPADQLIPLLKTANTENRFLIRDSLAIIGAVEAANEIE